jgi:hypothetical protein
MTIRLEILLLFIIIGVGIIYAFSPQPQVILKYPNDKNVYIDDKNVCYKYIKKYL